MKVNEKWKSRICQLFHTSVSFFKLYSLSQIQIYQLDNRRQKKLAFYNSTFISLWLKCLQYITNRHHCMRATFGHGNIIVLNENNHINNPMFCAQNLSYDYRGLVIMHTNQVDYCHRNFDMLFGQLQSPFCHPSSLCFTNGNVKHECFYYK